MMRIQIIMLLLISVLGATHPIMGQENESVVITVAKDGTGDFSTIQDAINSCKAFRNYEQIIKIKAGIYDEKVLIDSFHTNLVLVGESAERTIITHSDNASMEGFGTFNSYTLKVLGNHTTLSNLTIENTAGRVGQAVALHVEADYFKVKNCRILGNQDTLYAAGQYSRQHYEDCFIAGTTDFIFGAAISVFDRCTLHSLTNSYITAASRAEENEFGYVFRNCKLTASDEATRVYLGRPWRDYARVVFIDCEMGAHIKPEGWHNWGQSNREKTAFYAEYNSTGLGANTAQRVSWSHQLSEKEVEKYTLENIYSYQSAWDEQ